MAKSPKKLTLSPSRDIPFDLLELSQSNVRRIKSGVSIAELADDIARRTLLTSLNVRPILDGDGVETGRFEIPAGGRRYRALELLVKQKRLAKDAPIPCIVKQADAAISAEEDSYAENTFRMPLHPLDQFRAMQIMVDKGDEVEAIAAHFMATPAVVRQRLKLASVSPKLHEVYAEDGMTLDQLMAFTVTDDHERQEQVFEMLAHSHNRSAAFIRQRLTENTIRAQDKRVLFIGVEAYTAAGGAIARDLFEDDNGGWLTDPALLDRLVDEKLNAEAETVRAEGWKWVTTAIDLPWNATDGLREIVGTEVDMTEREQSQLEALQTEADELEEQWAQAHDVPAEVHARVDEIDRAIGALTTRPMIFDPEEMAIAGALISIEPNGELCIERGYVRFEDEPPVETEDDDTLEQEGGERDDRQDVVSGAGQTNDNEEEGTGLKPLPDRLVADLTAWRTLALADAIAREPEIAFVAVLHAVTLACFYYAKGEEFANMIAHLKKPDMAREAAVFLENTGWMPECLRTPGLEPANDDVAEAIAAE